MEAIASPDCLIFPVRVGHLAIPLFILSGYVAAFLTIGAGLLDLSRIFLR